MKSTKYAIEHGSTFGMSQRGNRTIILENLTFVPWKFLNRKCCKEHGV